MKSQNSQRRNRIQRIKDTAFVLLLVACLVCAFYGFYEQVTTFLTDWFVPLVSFKRTGGTDAAVVVASVALMLWALMKGPKRYSLKHISILVALWFLCKRSLLRLGFRII